MTISRTSVKKILFFQIFFNLFVRWLISIGLPDGIVYLNDVLLLLLFIILLFSKKSMFNSLKKIGLNSFVILLVSYLIYNTLNSLIHGVNPLHFMWGIRNYFRFFLFFLECYFVFESEDIEKIFRLFILAQIANVVITFYQYYQLGLTQDYLGGIFGTAIGSNAYTNIFFCILVSYAFSKYFNKQIKFGWLLFLLLSTLIIAALSEIKIFFIEFLFILLVIILLERFSFKTFFVVLLSAFVLTVSLIIFKETMPQQFEVLVNRDSFLNYASNAYSIDRINAFSQLSDIIFSKSIISTLVGYGMGSFEYSSFDFLTSSNYATWGFLHYDWFSHSFIFLEQGFIGLLIYILIIISVLFYSLSVKKNLSQTQYSYFFSYTVVMCLIYLINTWYNQIVRIEASYLFFATICAAPIFMKMEQMKNE